MKEIKKCGCCSNDSGNEENLKVQSNGEYICYCNKVTAEDIIYAIQEKNANTIDDIIKITGAMKNPNCVVNNPKKICCYDDIVSILKQYKKK